MRYLLALLALSLAMIPIAEAREPQYCFEDQADLCGLASGDPETIFQGIMDPLETQVPGFSMIIFWGGIMAILWFKTENIMLLGLVGIFVNATIIGISETAEGIGLLLLGVANGLLIYQMFRQRLQIFS